MTDVRDDAPVTTAKGEPPENGFPEGSGNTLIGQSVTINRPRQELYDYWRDFSHLPSFMENIISVELLDDRRSHWVVKAPGGQQVEWDSVVVDDREGEAIAWMSAEGADVPNSGRIEFRDAGDRGTVVTATIVYDPPAGMVGRVIAKMFQREPAIQARRDLRRLKQFMETGEIATSAHTRREFQEEQS